MFYMGSNQMEIRLCLDLKIEKVLLQNGLDNPKRVAG